MPCGVTNTRALRGRGLRASRPSRPSSPRLSWVGRSAVLGYGQLRAVSSHPQPGWSSVVACSDRRPAPSTITCAFWRVGGGASVESPDRRPSRRTPSRPARRFRATEPIDKPTTGAARDRWLSSSPSLSAWCLSSNASRHTPSTGRPTSPRHGHAVRSSTRSTALRLRCRSAPCSRRKRAAQRTAIER
jgi:hypothetical protein